MINGKSVLGIVTARGGSKRLPNKNILSLAGKPLLSYTIEAGMQSRYVDKIVVSSDSNKILKIAKNLDAKIIKRPKYISGDKALSFDVVKHAIEEIDEQYHYIILLQPTSPLRRSNHIDEACKLLIKKKSDGIISVCKASHSPFWINKLPMDKSMSGFLRSDILNKRSQDTGEFYMLNGAIFLCKTEKLLEQKTFFLKDEIYAYVMSRHDSIDIDEKIDFLFAKYLLERNNI